MKAKLKATSQEERIQLWKQHFKNSLGNPPKVTYEPIMRIISKQLDNKLEQFTQEELREYVEMKREEQHNKQNKRYNSSRLIRRYWRKKKD